MKTAALILFFLVSQVSFADDDLLSARLAQLHDQIQAGPETAVAQFWETVESESAPLVEPIEDQPGKVVVTFLWRADDPALGPNVSVASRLFIAEESIQQPLEQFEKTDIWYKSVVVPSQTRISYLFTFPRGRDANPDATLVNVVDGVTIEWFTDPNNPKFTRNDADSQLLLSYFEGPDAPDQQWLEPREGVPEGTVETFDIASAVLGNERKVSVYMPPGYAGNSRAYPFALLFDREEYLTRVPTPTIVDNLIDAGEMPPLVVILVGNISKLERSKELPPLDNRFTDFIIGELMPLVREKYRLSTSPHEAIIGGSSFGGLVSMYIAMLHPDVFGKVLSQSGSYWWHPGVYAGEPEEERLLKMGWLASQIIERHPLGLKVYQDVGVWEWPNMVVGNRHLNAVLAARGYETKYQEFYGAHDYLNWRNTLDDGLVWLMNDN